MFPRPVNVGVCRERAVVCREKKNLNESRPWENRTLSNSPRPSSTSTTTRTTSHATLSPHLQLFHTHQPATQNSMSELLLAAVQRAVPGAPPLKSLSKTQKKRRKGKTDSDRDDSAPATPLHDTTSAALLEEAPETPSVAAPELTVDETKPSEPDDAHKEKRSAIAEIIHKRLKANGKKIVRIFSFLPELDLIRA
jgi:hypothetical protein